MTNKWYRGVPTCQRSGGCVSSCFPSRHVQKRPPSVNARARLRVVACDTRSHVYLRKSMRVFTPFVGAAAPSPTLKPAPFLILLFLPLFSPSVCSNERRLGSVKTYPLFCQACQLFFFFLFFFLGGLLRKFTHPWHHSGSKKMKIKKNLNS